MEIMTYEHYVTENTSVTKKSWNMHPNVWKSSDLTRRNRLNTFSVMVTT